jgi:hypothetical protein
VAAGLGMRVRTGWATVGAASLVDAGTRPGPGLRVARASATVQGPCDLFNGFCQVNPQDPLSGHSGTTPDSRLRPAGPGRRPDYARFLTTKVTNVRRVLGSVPVTSQQPWAGDRWWDEPRL